MSRFSLWGLVWIASAQSLAQANTIFCLHGLWGRKRTVRTVLNIGGWPGVTWFVLPFGKEKQFVHNMTILFCLLRENLFCEFILGNHFSDTALRRRTRSQTRKLSIRWSRGMRMSCRFTSSSTWSGAARRPSSARPANRGWSRRANCPSGCWETRPRLMSWRMRMMTVDCSGGAAEPGRRWITRISSMIGTGWEPSGWVLDCMGVNYRCYDGCVMVLCYPWFVAPACLSEI